MKPNSPLTYQTNARYAFTMESEFNKSVVLDRDEKILYQTKVRLYSSFVFAQIAYFALTTKRVIVIKHYLLGADKVVSITLTDIIKIQLNQTGLLNGTFPLCKYCYITITYQANQLSFYASAKDYSKYWRPADGLTEKIYKQLTKIWTTKNL